MLYTVDSLEFREPACIEESMSKAARVDPISIWSQGHWAPEFFCGPGATLFGIVGFAQKLEDFAECIEGWRVSAQRHSASYDKRVESGLMIRQANIKDTVLDLEHI